MHLIPIVYRKQQNIMIRILYPNAFSTCSASKLYVNEKLKVNLVFFLKSAVVGGSNALDLSLCENDFYQYQNMRCM